MFAKFRTALLAALLTVGLGIPYLQAADAPISTLPAGAALAGTEAIPAVQSATTVKTTPAAIKTYIETGGTVTASDPVLDLTQTWNNAGVTFEGLKARFTTTAAATASELFDIRTADSTYGLTFERKGLMKLWGEGGSGNEYGIKYITDGGVTTSLGLIYSTVLGAQIYSASYGTFSAVSSSFNVQTGSFLSTTNYERLAIKPGAASGWMQVAVETGGTGTDNIGIALTPAGTGAISAQVPDSTTAGGNARGSRALDLQMERSAATQVASGTNAVTLGTRNTASNTGSITIGHNNTSNEAYSIAMGDSNTASGNRSAVSGGTSNSASSIYASVGGGNSNAASNTAARVGGGGTNTASGEYSVVRAGSANTASGQHSSVGGGFTNTGTALYSTVSGGALNDATATGATAGGGYDNDIDGQYGWSPGGIYCRSRGLYGGYCYAAGYHAAAGDAQVVGGVFRKQTADATPAILTSNGGSTLTSTYTIAVPVGATMACEALVTARVVGGGDSGAYKILFGIENVSGTTALVGASATTTIGEDVAGWDAVGVADNTNDTAQIQVTGAAATDIRWTAEMKCAQVGV